MPFLQFFRRHSLRSMLRAGLRYLFGKRGQRRVFGLRLSFRLRTMVLLYSSRRVGRAEARLWVDREVFVRIRKLLRRAKHTIIVQMFIWKDDALGRDIAEALVRAADRGVKVFVTKEATGDIFETEADFLATRESELHVWKQFWGHPNIRVRHALHDDHTKVFLIDGHVMLLMGMNIADEYIEFLHDYMVELRGSHFVQHYLRGQSAEGGRVQLIMNTDDRKEIRPTVMRLLQSARQSIVIEHAYFSDPQVVDALAKRSHEGVFVTVISHAHPDIHRFSNLAALQHLLARGSKRYLRVFLYPGTLHGKILVIDRMRAFLGSANMIASSLDRMGEVNVLLEGRSRAMRKLRAVLRNDLLQSRPLQQVYLPWLKRWMAWLQL